MRYTTVNIDLGFGIRTVLLSVHPCARKIAVNVKQQQLSHLLYGYFLFYIRMIIVDTIQIFCSFPRRYKHQY